MFAVKKGKVVFSNEFLDFLKEKENDRIFPDTQKSLTLVDYNLTTYLHLAAQFNNVDLAKTLLDSECNIDAQDCLGVTPICMAAINRNFEIIKMLLNANADIFITDFKGTSLLKHLLSDDVIIPGNIFLQLFEKLKKSTNSKLDEKSIAQYLIDAKCPFEYALLLKNSQVTKQMIKHDYFEVLLDPIELLSVIDDPLFDLTTVKSHIRQLARWDIDDESFLQKLKKFFMKTSNDKAVKMLLDFGIFYNMRKIYGVELLPYLFSNPNLNCVSLLKNRKFDVDMQYVTGSTLLHHATQNDNRKYVEFLLNSGANINLKNNKGLTAIVYVKSVECMKLLLIFGADIQSVDNKELTFFHYEMKADLVKEALAHLSITASQGSTIGKTTLEVIVGKSNFKKFYDECRRQIDGIMKKLVIGENFTVFDVLCAHPRDTSRYVGSERAAARILETCRECKLMPQFYSRLEEKLKNVVELHSYKITAIADTTKSTD